MISGHDVIALSRPQFGLVARYHFLCDLLTLGMSFILAIMESVCAMNGREAGSGGKCMWYFTWLLGVGFAAASGIINAVWPESNCDIDTYGIDHSCDGIRHEGGINTS